MSDIKSKTMQKTTFFSKILFPYQKYCSWKQAARDTIWYKICNLCLNLILAITAVVPLFSLICREVPFSYEVNDDATIAQILDGSYTGTPDGHAIFVRYPLSLLIKLLYEKNPLLRWGGESYENVNWYVAVIVMLEIFALVVVLFRILHYFTYNRILLCILFDIGVVMLWLPCFSNLTFSTAAAFMGCMGVLFFGLERKEEAWRPWNLLILGILLTAAWCLRRQCFLMVLPFLCIELVFKYHITFFRSVKPWFVGTFLAVLLGGVFLWNQQMYSSREWKDYLQYNQDRAYLQDYVGFPKYNKKNRGFYDAVGISENGREAMAKYTYCLVDGFDTDWVEKTWRYVKAQETEQSFVVRMKEAVPKAKEYFWESGNTSVLLKKTPVYLLGMLLPLAVLTFAYQLLGTLLDWFVSRKTVREDNCSPSLRTRICNRFSKLQSLTKETGSCIWTVLSIILMVAVLGMEWIYLAMNGRFPQRVEETIRLLTLCVAVLCLCKLLAFWNANRLTHIPVLLQLIVLAIFCENTLLSGQIARVQGQQQYHLQYAAEKAEILSYCGAHKENYYILDTRSFTKTSRPTDDLHQGNWFMSGSWTAYSPLYAQKLAQAGTSSLGSEFLLRENVYLITKGKKNVSVLLGLSENLEVKSEIVDEIMSSSNNFYVVYSIKGIVPAQ